MRLSAVVLPIVSVDADVSSVLHVAEGAPNSLEMEHVEVIIFFFYKMEKIDCQLSLVVSEGTHISVLARLCAVRISRAELNLVLFRMVELFYPIVSSRALITELAVLRSACHHEWADLARVEA